MSRRTTSTNQQQASRSGQVTSHQQESTSIEIPSSVSLSGLQSLQNVLASSVTAAITPAFQALGESLTNIQTSLNQLQQPTNPSSTSSNDPTCNSIPQGANVSTNSSAGGEQGLQGGTFNTHLSHASMPTSAQLANVPIMTPSTVPRIVDSLSTTQAIADRGRARAD